jgi:hypothetical protein
LTFGRNLTLLEGTTVFFAPLDMATTTGIVSSMISWLLQVLDLHHGYRRYIFYRHLPSDLARLADGITSSLVQLPIEELELQLPLPLGT